MRPRLRLLVVIALTLAPAARVHAEAALRQQLAALGVPDEALASVPDLDRALDAGIVDQQAMLKLSLAAPASLQPAAETAVWRHVRERLLRDPCSGSEAATLERGSAERTVIVDVPPGGFTRMRLEAESGTVLDVAAEPPGVRVRVLDGARCTRLADAGGRARARVPPGTEEVVLWIDDVSGVAAGSVELRIRPMRAGTPR